MATGKQRIRFTDIDPSELRHPLDRAATEQLKKLPFFDKLTAKFLELGGERIYRILNDANNVKVGPKQIPKLYRMLREGCAILDMPLPDLYLNQRPEVNAITYGHTKPFITLYSGLLEMMNEEEVMAVIAHELGHVKCGHSLYTMMGIQIDILLIALAQTIPAGKLLELGIIGAFNTWMRRAELTADRASLLVMQDRQPCISMLAKLAGGTAKEEYQLDPNEFLEQARHYTEEGNRGGAANRIYQFLANAYKTTHLFAVERAHYLNEWKESIECDQILKGNYSRIPRKIPGQTAPSLHISQGKDLFCSNCGKKALQATSKMCAGCGSEL